MVLVILAVSAGVWALLAGTLKGWEGIWEYRRVFLNGWLLTLGLSAAALVCSTLIGFLAATLRRSRILVLRAVATVYIEFIRGTPLLVQLLLFFYVFADAAGIGNRLVVGVLTLSLFSGAYIAEIIRAGMESVGETQRESARAIGLTPWQINRLVVLPQALRVSLPPLAGQFASLIKDSSLLSILGIAEFTLSAQQVNSATYSTLESYLPLAAGYLVLTLPISLWSRRMEERVRYEH